MRFKKFLYASLFLFVTAAVVGCANNYDFDEEALDIRLSFDTDCIDKIEPFFTDYMNEMSSENDINANIKCMVEAVDYVKFRVTGESKERYSIGEIKSFFNQFVFPDNPKGDSFYSRVLSIKKEIIGGSESYLTFKELETTQEILKTLGKTLIQLAPLSEEMIGSEPFKSKSDIEKVVFYAFGFLNDLFAYDIKSFSMKQIVELLGDFVDLNEDTDQWLEVFNLLRGKERADFVVEAGDRFVALETLARYYRVFFSLSYDLSGGWDESRQGFKSLESEVINFLDQLSWSLERKGDSTWNKEDLIHIFTLLSRNFAENISEETVSGLVDVVFSKWFVGKNDRTSFSLSTIDRVLRDINSLSDFLNQSQTVEGFVGLTFPSVSTATSLFDEFLKLAWPSMITKERSFLVDVAPFESEFNFKSLFQWSWAFTLSDVFSRAYAKDYRGLSIEQVEEAYLDVFGLLVDMDILTEASRLSWFRIFNEGDLLVPSARSNGYVSRQEMSEYFSYMFSAYFSGNEAFERAKEFCPGLSKDCVFESMKAPEAQFFRTMPSLNKYLSAPSSVQGFNLWADSFEYIAKLEVNDEPYTSNMFFRAGVGNQYVEVLFRKYDQDQSGTFNFDETENAFEDFKLALRLLPQVKGTIAESNDLILKAFFTYFVDNGELPELINGYPSGSFIKYMLFCGLFNANSCAFESDRSSILAILAYLTSVELVDE